MYCTFSLSFETSIVFQKIVYFAFMYVCIHWLMGGWTYWLCVCVWIQATLGTQRTACKSLLSFHHVGFRGQTQVIGLGSTDAYPLVYCVCFFLLLHVSSWCIPSVPLLLTEMIHSFKKFFCVLAPSQLDLNLWHYHSSFVHIYLITYGPTRVGDRHSSLWPYYIIWSRVSSWCKDCSYWTAAWDNSPCYSGWVFSDSFLPHYLIPPAIATDIRTLPPCSLWCCSWTLLSLHYFG